jgi:hypothetical protein
MVTPLGFSLQSFPSHSNLAPLSKHNTSPDVSAIQPLFHHGVAALIAKIDAYG